jgi:SAM-dependent methyltransferase
MAPLFVTFAEIRDGDRVLDLGCGTGALSSTILRQFPSCAVTGVDASPSFIEQARQESAGDRARFIVGDAQRLELPDAAFDRVVSSLVFNFIPNPAQALREAARVTRPGGVIAACVWDYSGGMEMLRAFWDEAAGLNQESRTRDEGNMPLSRRGELEALWRQNELAEVREEALTIEMVFASFDDYWLPFLEGQGPAGAYAMSLAEDARMRLRDRLRERLLGARADGPITLQGRAWAVRGERTG